MSEKPPLQEALRSEILKLASEGDPKSKELTPEILLRIMRVAKTGRDLLTALTVNPKNLAALVKRPRSPFGIPAYGGDDNLDDLGGDEGDGTLPIPYASAPAAENFGMVAIREIISAAKNLNGNGPSPVKLVEALAIAREKGLQDVAKDLEKQLGVGKEEVVVKTNNEKEEPKS